MQDESYDRDQEGKADELQARELGSALADLRAGVDRRVTIHKPCRKCGGADHRTVQGYAICEDCLLDMGSAS